MQQEMVISYTSGSSTSNSSIKSKLWYCGKSACQFIFFAKLCSDIKKTWLWIPMICLECIVNGWLPSPRTPVIISMQPPNVAQLCIIYECDSAPYLMHCTVEHWIQLLLTTYSIKFPIAIHGLMYTVYSLVLTVNNFSMHYMVWWFLSHDPSY